MTEIQNPKQKNNRFEPVCNLRFICNLVLGICDLRDTKLQGRAGEL
jgi:hypothetical protein